MIEIEELHPSRLDVSKGMVWVFAEWIPYEKFWERHGDMPVIVFGWWNANNMLVAMSHQSLQ